MLIWCGREDLNFHPVARTATSTLRVYQFRHDRTIQHHPFVQIKVARGKYEFNNNKMKESILVIAILLHRTLKVGVKFERG